MSIINLEHSITSYHDEKKEFEWDVKIGLTKPQKALSSKYFYDKKGGELFNQITQIPDYYLTNAELEILTANKAKIASLLQTEAFNLIELGPGEGIKTKVMIQQFLKERLNFRYTPIDISLSFLTSLANKFAQELDKLTITPIHADYFHGLQWQSDHSHRRNLVLFLGSSIGNFTQSETVAFLKHLWDLLHNGDYLLLGFDLKKDIKTLMRAYDDEQGITRDFNLNILQRINTELGGNFKLEKFSHYATYNVYSNAMESYLISREPQVVTVETLGKNFRFSAIEAIHTEYSHKYDIPQINTLAQTTGFIVLENFSDTQGFFINSLWKVKKTTTEDPEK